MYITVSVGRMGEYSYKTNVTDFGLQFRRELGVALFLSPTLSVFLAFQHTRWQIRWTTKVLISREDHKDRVACN